MSDARDVVAALDAVFAPFNRSDAPGLVAGVVHRGTTVYRRAFGLASVELGVANTVTTRMRIGSTSKHFTCLAALLLARDGKLDIDAGIRTYVPEIADIIDPPLRRLMSHTSGLRDYLDLAFLASGLALRRTGSALAMQVRQRHINYPLAERMIYCNGGYHLLSIAIERASGMPFEDFAKQRIFEPNAMHDTAFTPNDIDFDARRAAQHIPLPGGGYRRGVFPSDEVRGEGGVVSSLDDMLRWIANVRGPERFGGEAIWAQMLERTVLANGRVQPYCLGLIRTPYRGIETIHHGGSVMGGRCQMLTVPEHELDIVIITNGGTANPGELAKAVIDAVLGDDELDAAEVRPKSADYSALIGTRYHAPASGMLVEFAENAESLALRLLDNEPITLHGAAGRLRLDFEDLAMGPFEIDLPANGDASAAPHELAIAEGGNAERFVLLPALAGDALIDAGRALEGTYASDDLGESAHIAREGNELVLTVGGTFGTTFDLTPISHDVFAGKMRDDVMPLHSVINVDRAADGSVSGFRIDTGRTRRLAFVRT